MKTELEISENASPRAEEHVYIEISTEIVYIKKEPIDEDCPSEQHVKEEPQSADEDPNPLLPSDLVSVQVQESDPLVEKRRGRRRRPTLSKHEDDEISPSQTPPNADKTGSLTVSTRSRGLPARVSTSTQTTHTPLSKTRKKDYSCQICKKIFTQSGLLDRHMRIHTGERPYSCEICKKGFIQASDLRKHERVHTGEKPFSCDVCKKAFARSSDFKKHTLLHTGERPCICDICNKSFTDSSSLKKHSRLHTRKPFMCDVCKKIFKDANYLNEHTKLHNEIPFMCKICKKTFSNTSHLKRHRRVHTGERPYSCELCESTFKQSGHLERHKRSHSQTSNSLVSYFSRRKSIKRAKDIIPQDF